ncbi:spermidine synthase [Sphingomonadales bacterium 56]|uniref:Spermidine synthase n=1 Tax=Sphingobium agri TaxID=2933566 RepID=A0ABT0DZT4_9SPHN|nr:MULTISPECIES: spermidine synthase [Sphingobium]MBY2930764.1 spermidine synthase [Sphingomonadales bacterium 56]MBY2960845.1 spermidine synthase [Sphingomonadales bacterium 58]MCK0532630.1 spermidine synthase [Sphingobium agri]CAD7341968.1 Polyamine aminopropyltransferase [Sphingobium sp. S6]CAD7342039.1 Polyamine aminopropyltransferase [Sphingobium sp. S8]
MLASSDECATIPVELIGMAELPDGGRLRLLRRGQDYSIRFGNNELMGNQVRHSEEALATLTCQRVTEGDARVLIGGLGMGFTLGAALRSLPPTAEIMVTELIPEIVNWAKGPLSHLFHDYLSDPRVVLELADVHDVIASAEARFDAIMLDVDNGPDGLIHLANERLYCNWGLRTAHAALKPGGILAIWSAYSDDAFVARLESNGFDVDEVEVAAVVDGENTIHTVWLASKRP